MSQRSGGAWSPFYADSIWKLIPKAIIVATVTCARQPDRCPEECRATPVPGKCSEKKSSGAVFSESDFPAETRQVVDLYGKTHNNPFIASCPNGQTPHRSHYDYRSGKMEILNYPETCGQCAERAKCPVRYANGWMVVTIHAKPLRLSQRRCAQESEQFKDRYRRRSGIESTNSILKRTTGLGRLRVRGKSSVFHSLLLKVAGWNILRAASSKKMIAHLKGLLAAAIRRFRMLLRACSRACILPHEYKQFSHEISAPRRRPECYQRRDFCRPCPLAAQ